MNKQFLQVLALSAVICSIGSIGSVQAITIQPGSSLGDQMKLCKSISHKDTCNGDCEWMTGNDFCKAPNPGNISCCFLKLKPTRALP